MAAQVRCNGLDFVRETNAQNDSLTRRLMYTQIGWVHFSNKCNIYIYFSKSGLSVGHSREGLIHPGERDKIRYDREFFLCVVIVKIILKTTLHAVLR